MGLSRNREKTTLLCLWHFLTDDDTKHPINVSGVFYNCIVAQLPVSCHGSGSNSLVEEVFVFNVRLSCLDCEDTFLCGNFNIFPTKAGKGNFKYLGSFIKFLNVVRWITCAVRRHCVKSFECVFERSAQREGSICLPACEIVHNPLKAIEIRETRSASPYYFSTFGGE
jgi:hypothetical protein